jgi:hypothetical protein
MKYKSQTKYDKENTITVSIKLNKKTDNEIIDLLNRQSNKQGFIKQLLRKSSRNS